MDTAGTGIPIAGADPKSLGGANGVVFGMVLPGSGWGGRMVGRGSEEGPCAAEVAIPVGPASVRSLGGGDPVGGLGEGDRRLDRNLFLNFLRRVLIPLGILLV